MRTKFMNSSSKAFTLGEIMITVGIIAFLVVLAVPNFVTARNNVLKNNCINNQRVVYQAAALYELDTEASLEGIGSAEALQKLLDGNYVKENDCFECPESDSVSYDDYLFVYDGGKLTDVECTVRGNAHPWP